MFYTEKTYDLEELIRYNVHTHTVYSKCAKPDMVFEDMVLTAQREGLKLLCITDHSDPGDEIDTYANFLELKKRLIALNPSIRVLIGAELSAYGIGKYAEPYPVDKALDFASYSHIHYHLDCWEQPNDKTPRGYALHMLSVLNALLITGRADNIAHPFSPCKMKKILTNEQSVEMLESITDNELGDILLLGEQNECSWELHTSSVLCFPSFYRRFFQIGKEAGVHFTLGTDAHTLKALNPVSLLPDLKKALL